MSAHAVVVTRADMAEVDALKVARDAHGLRGELRATVLTGATVDTQSLPAHLVAWRVHEAGCGCGVAYAR